MEDKTYITMLTRDAYVPIAKRPVLGVISSCQHGLDRTGEGPTITHLCFGKLWWGVNL